MPGVRERIRSEIDKVRVVDTHEHIMPESERDNHALDFSYLFAHYNSSDLISAGMPPALMEAVRLPMYRYRVAMNERMHLGRFLPKPEPEGMSLEERWDAFEPYWDAIRNTAYAKQTLITARDIFGVDDLNRNTYQQLSQAIADSRRPGWYRHIMKERAGIDISILDRQTSDVDKEIFAPSVRLDTYIQVGSRVELGYLEQETDLSIHALDDLVCAMQTALKKHIDNGAVAVKSGLAYRRTLEYEKTPRHDAEVVFNRISGHLGEGPSWLEAKPLQDYMMHQVIRAAIDAGLPIQIHTGLQEGNENIVTNSDPTHLINLFVEYREARFDLFHGGYPFTHVWATLAKNFANVYPDLTWMYIISPEIGRRLLHELIETVPGNKILGYGGDSVTVEMAYGHLCMAKDVVSRVLSEKVEEGYMSENEAVTLGRRMLRDNPAALYGVELPE